MLVSTASADGAVLGDVTLLAASDKVLSSVASNTDYRGDLDLPLQQFSVSTDESGVVSVAAFANDESTATDLSDAMAQAIAHQAVADVEGLRTRQVSGLESEFARIESELAEARAALDANPDDPILQARRTALVASLEQTTERLTLLQTTPVDPPLSVLQRLLPFRRTRTSG